MKQFINKIKKIVSDVDICEQCIIKLFLDVNNINYNNSRFFVSYFLNIDNAKYDKIKSVFESMKIKPSISNLIEIFELLIPDDDKKNNGIVYTPDSIKQCIIHYVLGSNPIGKICDPSCGCGSFLISCAIYLNKTFKLSYTEIFEKYIYGMDISEKSIIKAQILYRFIILLNHENDNQLKCNLKVCDSLDKNNKFLKNIKFDYIVGNPPYVRSKNIDEYMKNNLKNWKSSSSGNVDLYIPFFELGLNLLKDNGILGYITPNTYLQSINGRSLRNYLLASNYHIKVLDYKDNKIFKKATNYTAVTIISKKSSQFEISYLSINDIEKIDDSASVIYNNNNFKFNQPWKMCNNDYLSMIKIINKMENKLGNYKIKNGLATLKNDIYFFTPCSEDKKYYYRIYNNKHYKIEKELCINVAKPNIIKNEIDLEQKIEKAIFPYFYKNHQYHIIDEKVIQNNYPEAYKFLVAVKDILLRRDKGKGNYAAWYAYGRTQGLNNQGKKILLPYIADKPTAILSKDENMLFYCGYAVFANTDKELLILKKILTSDVFWNYIQNTSKSYSKGYKALAKNYIKDFGIPEFNEADEKFLLNTSNKNKINEFLYSKYSA